MIPIQELLSRIRWDRDFGRADFVIGYYDRVTDGIIRVPLADLYFEADDHFSFELVDDTGALHSIPLHRIREVFRDGVLIWQRQR